MERNPATGGAGASVTSGTDGTDTSRGVAAGTVYLYPDKSAVIVPGEALSEAAVDRIRHLWARWKSAPGEAVVLADTFRVVLVNAAPHDA